MAGSRNGLLWVGVLSISLTILGCRLGPRGSIPPSHGLLPNIKSIWSMVLGTLVIQVLGSMNIFGPVHKGANVVPFCVGPIFA